MEDIAPWKRNEASGCWSDLYDQRARSRPSTVHHVIWHGLRDTRRNNDPCRVIRLNSAGAKRSSIMAVNGRLDRVPSQYSVADFHEPAATFDCAAERGMNDPSRLPQKNLVSTR